MLKTKQVPLRDIKIKTGVLKRTFQELSMYQKELETQQQRIDSLIKQQKDDHEIRKQNEVLEETKMMIPDCKKRLSKAYKELLDCVDGYPTEEEEITIAKELIQSISPVL